MQKIGENLNKQNVISIRVRFFVGVSTDMQVFTDFIVAMRVQTASGWYKVALSDNGSEWSCGQW